MKYDTLRSVKYMLESMFQPERMVVEFTSLIGTYRLARMTSHALSLHQQTMHDVMQHEVLSNIHTSHTETRPISHSLLLRSNVIDIYNMRCYLLCSLSTNTRLSKSQSRQWVLLWGCAATTEEQECAQRRGRGMYIVSVCDP